MTEKLVQSTYTVENRGKDTRLEWENTLKWISENSEYKII
jgi:hypothetical protein